MSALGRAHGANSNIIGPNHERAMVACLRHLHALGYSLADCAHPRRLGRSAKTLRRYARKAGLAFSDYVPRALKPRRARVSALKADAAL